MELEPKHKQFPLSVKKRIWGLPCVVCGLSGLTKVDHILPWSRGGKNTEANAQPLCHQCNHRKSNKLSNDELFAFYASNRDRHISRHAFLLASVTSNPFDGVDEANYAQLKIKCEREAL